MPSPHLRTAELVDSVAASPAGSDDDAVHQLAKMRGDVAAGYTASLNVAVDV
jgi:hypothetical protein